MRVKLSILGYSNAFSLISDSFDSNRHANPGELSISDDSFDAFDLVRCLVGVNRPAMSGK